MDKFDQIIKNAKRNVEPSTDFVDATMTKITNHRVKKHWAIKLWAPILVGGLAAVVLLFVTLSPGSTTYSFKTSPSKTKNSSGTSSQVASATEAAGTDNAALDSYLSGVQGSMNQENSDQNDANSYINDSQQEITVPTD
jgi:hypothetical protein